MTMKEPREPHKPQEPQDREPRDAPAELPVTFVDLDAGETPPRFAVYALDDTGRPAGRIGGFDGKTLRVDWGEAATVAFGPDVEDFKTLPRDSLAVYRVAQMAGLWRRQGLVLGRDLWDRFRFLFSCVSGTVRKCRPWFWDLLDDIRVKPLLALAQPARLKPITAALQPHLLFPLRCQPLCDGVIEIHERVCCCHFIPIPDLLERLRDILDRLPIPIPDPIPDPVPGPDPAPFAPRLLRAKARAIRQRGAAPDYAALPPESLYRDYLALRALPAEAARQYVQARPYLFPLFCHCELRKVGETPIQPGGTFDFCYLNLRPRPRGGFCVTTYAYRVKQLVNGVPTVVYDGLAAHQYFAAGEPVDLRSFDPRALACADGGGDPPPNEGAPFVMLEYVGRPGTHHFNFPAQAAASQVGALDADDGTITTGYAPDCPWGGALGLRLWFSPELEGTVAYYRLRAVAVNDAGQPVGTPEVLNANVAWDKFADVAGDLKVVSELLGPMVVGTEADLFRVPYWHSPDRRYLSGQLHQVWNTASGRFPDGRYLLLIEVFDGAGQRIQPNGAPGAFPARPFQFRRWAAAADTDPVPFADAAHVFWVDNTPVGGDIVDLRKGGIENTAECQFLSGSAATTFSIGLRAYHLHGVDHAGNGDANSFMWQYGIGWQRGLNGDTGTLGFAPSGGSNHTDVGETGAAVASGSATFASMLTRQDGSGTVLPKCTFSVTLRVYAKHFNGWRINAYDYEETASFALEITP